MSFYQGMKVLILLSVATSISANSCQLKSANQVLSLVKKNHPKILKNQKKLEMSRADVEGADVFKNPELELEGVSNLKESSSYEGAIRLTQTFELGGKRMARVDKARREYQLTQSLGSLESENIVIETVKSLYRLRHMNELIPLYLESIDAFQRIHKKLVNRTSLSAEQQVEKETLELAINDYQLKLANIRVDRTYLKNHLSFFAGNNCDVTDSASARELDLRAQSVPTSINQASFSKLQVAKDYLNIQRAKLKVAEGEAYSDLRFGPVFEIDKDDETVKRAGVSLSFDLPLFNRNKAGKARAQAELSAAQIHFKKFEQEAKLDLFSWQTQYQKYIQSLKRMDGKAKLDKKHKKVEALFKRGIISTSLVIESHRQLIEYSSTRNSFELGAVEALWNIYHHNGEVLAKEL